MANYVDAIDGNLIYATRAERDASGNDIGETYATKSEIPSVPVQDVTVDGLSVLNGQGVAVITTPTFTQQNADWNSDSGVTEILNKPTLAEVATSGDYNDLDNAPMRRTFAEFRDGYYETYTHSFNLGQTTEFDTGLNDDEITVGSSGFAVPVSGMYRITMELKLSCTAVASSPISLVYGVKSGDVSLAAAYAVLDNTNSSFVSSVYLHATVSLSGGTMIMPYILENGTPPSTPSDPFGATLVSISFEKIGAYVRQRQYEVIGGTRYEVATMADGSTWMVENLRYETSDSKYNSSRPQYGRYYSRTDAAAVDSAISGWHLPTLDEFKSLMEANGAVMKDYTDDGWRYVQLDNDVYSREAANLVVVQSMLSTGYEQYEWPDTTNTTGFSAVPSGYWYNGSYGNVDQDFRIWTGQVTPDPDGTYYINMDEDITQWSHYGTAGTFEEFMHYMPIRLVKDT